MRWYIIRALLHKEAMRHIAERGGIFLILLLIAAVIVLRFFDKNPGQGGTGTGMIGSARRYVVHYWEKDSPWMQYLESNISPELRGRVLVRHISSANLKPGEVITYREGWAAVQVRTYDKDAEGRQRYKIMFWQPGTDPAEIAPLADWFWKETCRYFHARNTPIGLVSSDAILLPKPEEAIIVVQPAGTDGEGKPRSRSVFWPGAASGNGSATLAESWQKEAARLAPPPVEMDVEQRELTDNADLKTMLVMGMIFFAICIFSVYLMPSLTCEERERGVLLAQALSPASTGEILAAKFLFYPTMGIALAALLAGIYRTSVLLNPFFWLWVVAVAIGYLGVGQTIASLARTQRRASMSALFYMLTVTLFLAICSLNGISFLAYLTIEYNFPNAILGALKGKVGWVEWFHLLAGSVLAVGWAVLAGILFRRRGWQ
jgi:ABC-2 family transporter protein